MTTTKAEATAKSRPPKLAVGCVTRGRPAMFAEALNSLAVLDLPDDTEVVFCFVENAEQLSVEAEVEAFRARLPNADVQLACEPRLGIPFARNKALDMALKADCDFLSFIDDDETVDRSWLKYLYAALNEKKLDLIGGPVRTLPPKAPLPFLRRSILKGLIARANRIELAARVRTFNKMDHTVSIVTNNWLARLDFLRTNGIRFDESLGLSGGSDIAIFREIQKAGGETGWAPDAVVYEEIPESRLSLSYQFARGRDQQLATYNIKRMQTGRKRILSSVFFIILKSFVGLLRVVFAPLFGGTTLVLGLRAFGAAVGRWKGLTGSRSTHYDKVAGH